MSTKPHAPACDRNRDPILEVLRKHFADRHRVLEIGSGTGQHAVYFAPALPQLVWQASERAENIAGIDAWLDDASLANTPPPLILDVATGPWPEGPFDAVFSANTLHIMAWREVEALFAALPAITTSNAKLAIYGPFNRDGAFTSDSNAVFEASLKARGAHMGIRDVADVDALAREAGFALIDEVTMPANNFMRIWQRKAS